MTARDIAEYMLEFTPMRTAARRPSPAPAAATGCFIAGTTTAR